MKINLAFVTGARSEYGLAKPLLKIEVRSKNKFDDFPYWYASIEGIRLYFG